MFDLPQAVTDLIGESGSAMPPGILSVARLMVARNFVKASSFRGAGPAPVSKPLGTHVGAHRP
jgi:hypothetical protein